MTLTFVTHEEIFKNLFVPPNKKIDDFKILHSKNLPSGLFNMEFFSFADQYFLLKKIATTDWS